MEIPGTKRFIPKGFELGTTLSKPNGSILRTSETRTIFTYCSYPSPCNRRRRNWPRAPGRVLAPHDKNSPVPAI